MKKIARRSIIYSFGDIVWVPFPFVESSKRRKRPALIVSNATMGPKQNIYWAMMITSAKNSVWPEDIATGDAYSEIGLPVACYIRTAKIATIQQSDIVEKMGNLTEKLSKKVKTFLKKQTS